MIVLRKSGDLWWTRLLGTDHQHDLRPRKPEPSTRDRTYDHSGSPMILIGRNSLPTKNVQLKYKEQCDMSCPYCLHNMEIMGTRGRSKCGSEHSSERPPKFVISINEYHVSSRQQSARQRTNEHTILHKGQDKKVWSQSFTEEKEEKLQRRDPSGYRQVVGTRDELFSEVLLRWSTSHTASRPSSQEDSSRI